MNLKHTMPDTLQKQAVIARSRHLTDFKWTPVRDVPTYTKKVGKTVLEAGVEVTGFPYSSTELKDKFFTENVSIETFLSAIKNPYSKLYQPGTAAFNSCSYGVVCNGLARYAFGIKRRVSTLKWHTIPGMRCIEKRNEYTVEDIQLCDVLLAVNEGRNHVALITDILKNDDDEIVYIEVSEAVRPLCKRASYTPNEFYEKYTLFGLWRYDHLDQVPLLDEYTEKIFENNPYINTPKIAVDNGNKSNYLEGEDVIISVNIDGEDILQVTKDGEIIEEAPVCKKALFPRGFLKGYYVLKLKNNNDFTEFCVNKAHIEHTVDDGKIIVTADSCDSKSKILYMDFRIAGEECASLAKYEELTDEEKSSGKIIRQIPEDAENFKVYFENQYGVWVHKMRKIQSKQ